MHKIYFTSQGDYNLYKNGKSGEYLPLEDDVQAETAVAKNLYIQDFTLSINGRHNIYLINGTSIKPKAEGSSLNLEAAMRVGIMKYNTETQKYELCLIWLPNVGSNSNLDSEITVVVPDGEGGANEEKLTISSEHGDTTYNGVRYVWGEIDGKTENNILVGELSGLEKYRCVIWLDGNDRDCSADFLDQDIVATFKFNPEIIVESKTDEATE